MTKSLLENLFKGSTMVDNCKFKVKQSGVYIDSFLVHLRMSSKIITLSHNKSYCHAFLYKVKNINELTNKRRNELPHLNLVIKFDEGSVKGYGDISITVQNSIRKWYLGARSTRDFSCLSFDKCLKGLAKLLGVNFCNVLYASVFDVEIGYNLILPKQMESVLKCAIRHKTLSDAAYYKTTTSFEGVNYSVKMYDKLQDLFDGGLIKKKVRDTLGKEKFFLRIEIDYEKVSGVKFAKDNLGTIMDILINWEAIYDEIIESIKGMFFVDWVSPRMMERINKNTDKDFDIFLISLAIDSLGMQRMHELLKLHSNRVSLQLKKYSRYAESFRELRKPSFKEVLISESNKKRKELLKGIELI